MVGRANPRIPLLVPSVAIVPLQRRSSATLRSSGNSRISFEPVISRKRVATVDESKVMIKHFSTDHFNKVATVIRLTYNRARITLASTSDLMFYEDGW